ncbi:DNA-binding protein [Salmonella enterica subsp. enterica]|nr:DNA-binding protein [Salmonella enterica subsp. enterica serovar Abaetetuba]
MSQWKRAETLIIRQCAGKMRVADIGRLIGRTRDAVRTKARELNICLILRGDYHQSAKYRLGDVELARELYREGISQRDIAENLEMPVGMVRQYVYFDRRVG